MRQKESWTIRDKTLQTIEKPELSNKSNVVVVVCNVVSCSIYQASDVKY